MASEIGVRMKFDVDSSEAERKINHINSLISSDNSNNLPSLQNMGNSGAQNSGTPDLFGNTDINAQNNSENLLEINEQLKNIFRVIRENTQNNLGPINDFIRDPSQTRDIIPIPDLPNNSDNSNEPENKKNILSSKILRGMKNSSNQVNVSTSYAQQGDGLGGVSDILTNFGSILATAIPGLGIAGLITAGVGMAGKQFDKLSNAWEGRMGNAMQGQALFGNVSSLSAVENSNQLRTMFDNASSRRFYDNTRFSTEEYLSTQNSLARYGLSRSAALNNASDILKWENSTYANRDLLTQLTGITSRYGNEDKALQTAFNAAKASNLSTGQSDEFLNAMLNVIEEGIENGFTRSSEDVAENLVMLNKLSNDNPYWTGEKGAKNLSSMNSGMSNATGLNSVTDVMLLRAVMGTPGAYNSKYGDISYLMQMEKGVNYDVLANLKTQIGNLPVDEQIGILKNAFGLSSWTSASQLFDIMGNIGKSGYSKESIIQSIEQANAENKYDSKEQELINYQNTLKDAVSRIGRDATDIKKDVSSLAKHFIKPEEGYEDAKISDYGTERVTKSVVTGSNTSITGQEALYTGLEEGYIDIALAALSDRQMINGSGFALDIDNASSKMKLGDDKKKRFYKWNDLLLHTDRGDNERDDIILKNFSQAAYNDDNHISAQEILKLYQTLSKKEISEAYSNKDISSREFETIIQNAIQSAFNNVSISLSK